MIRFVVIASALTLFVQAANVGYRHLTISPSELTQNDTKTITAYNATISVIYRPNMVPQPIKLDAIPTESIVVKNLLADSIVTIEYREHYGNGSSVHVPYTTRHVMSSRNAQISALPGKPRSVSLCVQEASYTSCGMKGRVCWKTPKNVYDSTDPIVKSIQYDVSVCHFNSFSQKTSDCKVIATVANDNAKEDQSTYSPNNNATLFRYNPLFPTERDFAIIVQAVALNGTRGGESQVKISRINTDVAPPPPRSRTTQNRYRDSISMFWDPVPYATKYRIKYSDTVDLNDKFLVVDDTHVTITGLSANTNYHIGIAVEESQYGQSKTYNFYSSTVSTNNKVNPFTTAAPTTTTKTPSNRSSMMHPNLVLVLLFLLRFLYL